eukprot:362274-Chlamydomonas_euryale.AAC.7
MASKAEKVVRVVQLVKSEGSVHTPIHDVCKPGKWHTPPLPTEMSSRRAACMACVVSKDTIANPRVGCAAAACASVMHEACVRPRPAAGRWFCIQHRKATPVDTLP